MKDKNNYREQAINALYKRDETNKPVGIITPKSWIYLIIFFIIFVSAILWFIFGTITIQIDGRGILLSRNSTVIKVMPAENGGYIEQIYFQVGAEVKKGQLMATLFNPDLETKIQTLKQNLEDEKKKLFELKQASYLEIKSRIQKIDELSAIIQRTLHKLQPEDELTEIRLKTELFNLTEKKEDYIEDWNDDIDIINDKIHSLTLQMNILFNKNNNAKKIISPADGIVLTNYAKVGDYINKNQPLGLLTTNSKDLEMIAYINAEEAKRIKPGMPAKIFLDHIRTIEFGGLIGQVTVVSELPVNLEEIKNLLENEAIVADLLKDGPVFEVHLNLERSTKTYSGYVWTTSEGPQEKITQGSFASVSIIAEQKSPYALIIPVITHATQSLVNRHDP